MLIFKGEIARACGGILGGSEAFGDVCIFLSLMLTVFRDCVVFQPDMG